MIPICAGQLLIMQTENVFMQEGVAGRLISYGRSQGKWLIFIKEKCYDLLVPPVVTHQRVLLG